MPKSPLEKQIEKYTRQQKQLADKQRKDDQKAVREARTAANKDARTQQAASIIAGRPIVEGFRVMDKTAEEILSCLLPCDKNPNHCINYSTEIFPPYTHTALPLELEKLVQYGMISGVNIWMRGGMLTLLPPALSYFQDKENALNLQKKHEEEQRMQGGNTVNIYGDAFSVVVGDNNTTTINYNGVATALDEIKQSLESEQIDDEAKQDALELLAEISAKIEAKKSPAIITTTLRSLREFLIACGASTTAGLIVQWLQQLG